MARWLVKILKTLINTGESGIVYCMECGKCVGLTLTWDVLKLYSFSKRRLTALGLTLTWDVLKFFCKVSFSRCSSINFNMGCIEISRNCCQFLCSVGLTLTWDVLKFVDL